MGIVQKEMNSLIALTMESLPLPPVADMLEITVPGEDPEYMVEFLRANYSEEQLKAGIVEYLERIKFMNQLFSVKWDNRE